MIVEKLAFIATDLLLFVITYLLIVIIFSNNMRIILQIFKKSIFHPHFYLLNFLISTVHIIHITIILKQIYAENQ